MNRKLKALGLALVAALGLTAVMASAASAQFTSNKEHTIYSGSQKAGTNEVITAGEGFGGITCENATFSGTGSTTNDTSWNLSSNSSSCVDSFGRVTHRDVEGTTSHILTRNGVHCATPCTVKYTVTSGGSVVCTITIKNPQTNNGNSYVNLGGTSGVEVTIHSTNIISTTSGGFFNCGISNGEHKNGTYDGVWIITGKDTTGAAASISVD